MFAPWRSDSSERRSILGRKLSVEEVPLTGYRSGAFDTDTTTTDYDSSPRHVPATRDNDQTPKHVTLTSPPPPSHIKRGPRWV
jgi:hypothetical protein